MGTEMVVLRTTSRSAYPWIGLYFFLANCGLIWLLVEVRKALGFQDVSVSLVPRCSLSFLRCEKGCWMEWLLIFANFFPLRETWGKAEDAESGRTFQDGRANQSEDEAANEVLTTPFPSFLPLLFLLGKTGGREKSKSPSLKPASLSSLFGC